LTAEQWTDLDLTRLLESRTTVLKVLDGERLSVQESLGGVTVEHVLDKSTGTPVRTVMPVGPVSIELERVYIQGSF
jgi:predicted alpha/beta hydrolase family esterase